MTPQPTRMQHYPREAALSSRTVADVGKEVAKYIVCMLLSSAAAHVATIYGLREDVAVLKSQLATQAESTRQLHQKVDSLLLLLAGHKTP